MKRFFSSYYISIFCVFLSAILVWASYPVYASTQSGVMEDSFLQYYKKIDPTVYEKSKQKNQKYLVYIFRDDIPTVTIDEMVAKETRFDVSLYETDRFSSCIVPELEKQIINFNQIPQMQTSLTKLVLGEPNNPTIEKIKQDEMNAYIMAKRGIIQKLNSAKNDVFVNKYIDDRSDIVYQGEYTSTIIAYLTKDEIEKLAQLDEVSRIAPCEQKQLISEGNIFPAQIGTDLTTGTNSNQYNSGLGYRGDGIKIGIIEGEYGIYDPNHPQLAEIHQNLRLSVLPNERSDGSFVPEIITEHATVITLLIVGQSISENTNLFEGIVPNATVYQMAAYNPTDVLNAVKALLKKGVSVINCSAGVSYYEDLYSPFDLEIDKSFSTTCASFVKSAGNEGPDPTNGVDISEATWHVTSPGKAYNVITVGAASSKSGMLSSCNPPYLLYSASSYIVDSYLTNKPDIVAPGYYISYHKYVSETGSLQRVSANGTSLSAALVTGVVAQMHQANANLKSNPTATKAILLAGADFDVISGEDNDLWDYCYAARVKSGVGFLNAERAVRIAEAGDYDYNVYFLNITSRYVEKSIICEEVYIPANHKIRMVMTYSKPNAIADAETFANGNDMDLDLFYQDRTWCDSSLTPYNNVEVVEYVVDTAGTYSIEVYVPKLTEAQLGTYIQRTVAWCIEPAS